MNDTSSEYKINADNTAAVSQHVYWLDDMENCPRGVNLFLLGAGGKPACSVYNGDPFWVGWFPALKRRSKPEPTE